MTTTTRTLWSDYVMLLPDGPVTLKEGESYETSATEDERGDVLVKTSIGIFPVPLHFFREATHDGSI